MKILNNLKLAISTGLFLLIFCASSKCEAQDQDAGSPRFVIVEGNLVATWQAVDVNDNQIIVGATGTVSTSPSTWNLTTLSMGISSGGNTNPYLFSNPGGDVVVIWEYPDSNGNFQVGASILPFGASTWNTVALTTPGGVNNSDFFDQTASIDSSGNILALWSTYNTATNVIGIQGATSVVGTSSTWTVFNVAP